MNARRCELEWITADRVRLYAQSWEPASAALAAVGIVHGLGEHSSRYDHVARKLAEAGYRVVAFDQRGHGRTTGQRGHAPRYDLLLDDISLLVAELSSEDHQGHRFLYGHSLGGNLVLNYALRRRPQLDGLVVSSPLLTPAVKPPAWKIALCRTLNHVYPRFSFEIGVTAEKLSHDVQAARAYEQDSLMHRRVSARLATQMFAAGRWALEHAGQLTLPLLLMHGAADEVTSAASSKEFSHRAAATTTLKVWEGLYHELHWETVREEVMLAVIDWLQQTVTTRSENGMGSR